MNIKKIISVILLIIIISGCLYFTLMTKEVTIYNEKDKLDVVVTTFSAYDFTKHIAGDNINLTFLLGPGVDSHGYEPSAADIVKIQNADVFIYVGGTLEPWSKKIISNLPESVKTLRLIDSIDLKEEIKIDGTQYEEKHSHEDEEINEREYDEHIWTSTENATEMIKYIETSLSDLDSNNSKLYKENSKKYIEEINNVKQEIKEIVTTAKRKKLVFGDKMPMQYFIEEFGFDVVAAFNGCAEETVPTSKTIAYLVDLIKNEKIPVILYIELSEGRVAKTLAKETGAKTMQIQTLHNISKEDFENGETYTSLMKRNIEVLKEALN